MLAAKFELPTTAMPQSADAVVPHAMSHGTSRITRHGCYEAAAESDGNTRFFFPSVSKCFSCLMPRKIAPESLSNGMSSGINGHNSMSRAINGHGMGDEVTTVPAAPDPAGETMAKPAGTLAKAEGETIAVAAEKTAKKTMTATAEKTLEESMAMSAATRTPDTQDATTGPTTACQEASTTPAKIPIPISTVSPGSVVFKPWPSRYASNWNSRESSHDKSNYTSDSQQCQSQRENSTQKRHDITVAKETPLFTTRKFTTRREPGMNSSKPTKPTRSTFHKENSAEAEAKKTLRLRILKKHLIESRGLDERRESSNTMAQTEAQYNSFNRSTGTNTTSNVTSHSSDNNTVRLSDLHSGIAHLQRLLALLVDGEIRGRTWRNSRSLTRFQTQVENTLQAVAKVSDPIVHHDLSPENCKYKNRLRGQENNPFIISSKDVLDKLEKKTSAIIVAVSQDKDANTGDICLAQSYVAQLIRILTREDDMICMQFKNSVEEILRKGYCL